MKWNLALLYKSPTDPQIERDVRSFERSHEAFAKRYDTPKHEYLSDPVVLDKAITDLEKMMAVGDKPLLYFYYLRDIEADNKIALSQIPLLDNRMTKAANAVTFFAVLLGKIPLKKQKEFLADKRLTKHKVFLQRVFDDARHRLSVEEEKIMSLKSLPAYEMWVSGNEKALNMLTVPWKGKDIPMAKALNTVQGLPSARERARLSAAISQKLKEIAFFSEAEMNAIATNKKINDELRGYSTAHENTVLGYRNDPSVIDELVKTITKSFSIAHRFHKLKAKLLKQKRLSYSDRAAKIGEVKSTYPFADSVKLLQDALGKIDPKYPKILGDFIHNGQIDAAPRVGKRGGAYCWGTYANPTFVMLNHIGDLHSFTTLAHEMGHAFHTELSRAQSPKYFDYSTSLAETASTLFEAIALDAIYDSLPDEEKIVVLHDKINDFIATVFRQIACFNYESEIHATIRSKGYMSKEELADAHNRNMQAYLGPLFDLKRDDGYYFVHWMHIRRFFYVYTYAYGMLVSSALLRRYRKDPSFWKKIEQFLSSGGNDSPENILKKIGIDVSNPGFWREGLKEIEKDITRLERLLTVCY